LTSDPEPTATNDFGDPRAEYRAARVSAALFDLPDRAQIEMTGRDRAKFLHNFCTSDIRGLTPGRACETFLTSVQGKVLAYVSVYATADSLWLASVPGCADRIIAHLSRYQISEEVTFTDRSPELGMLMIAGPRSASVTNAVFPSATLPPGSPAVAVAGLDHGALQIRRHDLLRLPGFFVVAPHSAIEGCREKLIEAGAVPAGQSTFEALRIEAGFPLYGVDLTEANLAQEASRTAVAISFTKGCYLGQEPIARIDALGHVNQQLRGLELAGGPVPPPGSEVLTPGLEPRKIGEVTSAAMSHGTDRPVALAYVRRGFDAPGTALEVRVNTATVPAVVFWPGD
jgi:folate-binding protein YgfZ